MFQNFKPKTEAPKQTKAQTLAEQMLAELSKKHNLDLKTAECCDFKGSETNQNIVYEAIKNKYGEEEANEYVPAQNVMPKTRWLQKGFVVNKDEKPLTFIQTKRNDEVKNVALFHKNQVALA
jgi:hypothetical protein